LLLLPLPLLLLLLPLLLLLLLLSAGAHLNADLHRCCRAERGTSWYVEYHSRPPSLLPCVPSLPTPSFAAPSFAFASSSAASTTIFGSATFQLFSPACNLTPGNRGRGSTSCSAPPARRKSSSTTASFSIGLSEQVE
jgi:hypothetical protein